MIRGLALGLLGTLGVWSSVANAEIIWTLPASCSHGTFHSLNLIAFADDVRELTAGELDITVITDPSLRPKPSLPQAVRSGEIAMGELPLADLGFDDPLFLIDTLPYLVTGYDDAQVLANRVRPSIERRLTEMNLKLLFWVPWPPQGLFVSGPIRKPADLAGRPVWAYGAMANTLAASAGMESVDIAWPSLPDALASGRVHGLFGSVAIGPETRILEHADHFYRLDAWIPKNATLVNLDAWRALPDPLRDDVLKAAEAASVRGWTESRRLATSFLARLTETGVTVLPPSSTLDRFFRNLGESIVDDWLAGVGEDERSLIEDFYG